MITISKDKVNKAFDAVMSSTGIGAITASGTTISEAFSNYINSMVGNQDFSFLNENEDVVISFGEPLSSYEMSLIQPAFQFAYEGDSNIIIDSNNDKHTYLVRNGKLEHSVVTSKQVFEYFENNI